MGHEKVVLFRQKILTCHKFDRKKKRHVSRTFGRVGSIQHVNPVSQLSPTFDLKIITWNISGLSLDDTAMITDLATNDQGGFGFDVICLQELSRTHAHLHDVTLDTGHRILIGPYIANRSRQAIIVRMNRVQSIQAIVRKQYHMLIPFRDVIFINTHLPNHAPRTTLRPIFVEIGNDIRSHCGRGNATLPIVFAGDVNTHMVENNGTIGPHAKGTKLSPTDTNQCIGAKCWRDFWWTLMSNPFYFPRCGPHADPLVPSLPDTA